MKEYIPDIYQKSIFTIDYTKLLSKGIKCILFDLDNTIISKSNNEEPAKAKKLITSLKQKGFTVIILSNSYRKKINKYKCYFDIDGLYLALKPMQWGFKRAFKKCGYNKNEMAIIGDQIMTDILGGNRFGITTILVNPINENDIFITKFNRLREKKTMDKLAKNNLFKKGDYYD